MSKTTQVWLLLVPALTVVGAFFLGGLFFGLTRSLNYMPLIGLTEPNLQAYASIFNSAEFYRALALSLHIAFTSTALATVIAIACALLLRETFAGKRIVTFVFQLNLTIPHLVGGVAILFLLSQSGLIARVAHALGIIDSTTEFPALVFDRYAIGIIVQYVWKEVPFIGVIALAVLQSVGDDYESVARSLGAGWWQRLRYVILPLIMPGVLRASIVVFAFTFGAFEIPFLLGQTYPSALPVLAYRSYVDVDLAARPEAMAMGIVIAVISACLIFLYMQVSRRYVRRD